jgi:hypothetical protein
MKAPSAAPRPQPSPVEQALNSIPPEYIAMAAAQMARAKAKTPPNA